MSRADLLLLDEPTNHLDLDAVLWLEQWLASYPRHAAAGLARPRVPRRLRHARRCTSTRGAWRATPATTRRSSGSAPRSSRCSRRRYEKQQREIAHMAAFIERFRAKATKARQAQSRLKALDRMERIAAAHVDAPFDFEFPARPSARRIRCSRCRRSRRRLRRARRARRRGAQRCGPAHALGLLGPNGAGKSTLIKALAGELDAAVGGTRVEGKASRSAISRSTRSSSCATTSRRSRHLAAARAAGARAGPAQLPRRLRLSRRHGRRAGRTVLGRREIASRAGADRAPAAEPAAARRADQPPRPRDAPRAHARAGRSSKAAWCWCRTTAHCCARSATASCWSPTARATPFDGDLDDYLAWLGRRRDQPKSRMLRGRPMHASCAARSATPHPPRGARCSRAGGRCSRKQRSSRPS